MSNAEYTPQSIEPKWQKYWLENEAKFYYWMSNPFHPNAEGHRVFAKLLLEKLDIFDANSSSGRLFIP